MISRTRPHPWLVLLPALVGLAIAPAELSAVGAETSPFADPDMHPPIRARCGDIQALTRDAETGPQRVDFSVVGSLELVHFDGTLAYLGLCAPPDPRVLCVTYSTNDMKPGDVVVVAGGYTRPDADLIVLDPCLASPDRPESEHSD